MKKQGTVVRWDEARAFGFIRSPGTDAEVFFHIRDYVARPQVPRTGMAVTFEEIHVGGKGPRAVHVQPAGTPAVARRQAHSKAARRAQSGGAPAWLALPLMLAYGVALAWAVWQGHLPWWILPASAGVNLVAFMAYWQDKYAAATGKWRTPENSLHLLSLAGGWAGAWFAQQLLRHKTSKPSFLRMFWLTLLLHCGFAGWWMWRNLR